MPINSAPIKPDENKVNDVMQKGVEAAGNALTPEQKAEIEERLKANGKGIKDSDKYTENTISTEKKTTTTDSNSENKAKEENSTGDGVEKKQTPIINFTKLVLGTRFQSTLKSPFLKPGYMSLLDAIKSLLSFTYYNIYTVPTLKDNNCIIIKPETFFVMIPKCNIILPSMKHSVSYSLNSKYAPTRVLFITDPLQIQGSSDKSVKMATVAAVKYGDSEKGLSGDIDILASNIKKVEVTNSDSWPVYQLTDYEIDFGPRLYNDMGGGDLIAYIEAYSVNNPDIKSAEVAEAVENLAKYTLLKARYISRTGSVATYFNPYIVPGFPLAIIEDKTKNSAATNIYGYVTAVIHNITYNSWSTSVTFSASTVDGEIRPDAFPVAEDDYKPENISSTYANLLGTSDCYDTKTISSMLEKETQDSYTVTDSFNFIKRPVTTLQEFLQSMTGTATEPIVKNNVMRIESSLYKKDIQEKIIEYSENILAKDKHFALHTKDIR